MPSAIHYVLHERGDKNKPTGFVLVHFKCECGVDMFYHSESTNPPPPKHKPNCPAGRRPARCKDDGSFNWWLTEADEPVLVEYKEPQDLRRGFEAEWHAMKDAAERRRAVPKASQTTGIWRNYA